VAGLPPKNSNVKNIAIKIQKKRMCIFEEGAGSVFFGTGYNGNTNQIRIADNIPITPPNLLGQARRIA
jgi:hypothetical protein